MMVIEEIMKARDANSVSLFITTSKEVIDRFINHYGGEYCTDADGREFISYMGYKIYYRTVGEYEKRLNVFETHISPEFISQEIESHERSLEFFKRWGADRMVKDDNTQES